MKYSNLDAFRVWAKQYIKWKQDNNQSIESIEIKALCIAHYNPSTGLITVNQTQNNIVITGINKQ